MEKITVGTHMFEIVDSVPVGYMIWNIGKNMIDGYLPLCRLSSRQPFPGGRNIDPDTLKAIKTDAAQIILNAVGFGCYTVADMEKFLKRYSKAKKGTIKYDECARIRKALPFMKTIKGL